MSLRYATIEKLAFGGNGICRIDGKVCFVPFSCPGDELSLRITAEKKSYSIASIDEIITPSAERTVPVCAIFGICGGCSWQHIGYAAQIRHKRSILEETLWRGGRVLGDVIDDAIPASSQYGYRNRLQFKVSASNDTLLTGFFRQGSHHVVDAAGGCPVAHPVINQVLECCRSMLKTYPDIETVSQLCIDAGDSGVNIVIIQSGNVTANNRAFFAGRSADFGSCGTLFIKSTKQHVPEKLWGNAEIFYRMNQADSEKKPLQLSYLPGGFAQVNQQQNNAMLSLIRRLGGFSSAEHILDLYCGNGNFSLPLAAEVASVTGIEGNPDSIIAAERNKNINNVANVQFFCDDVASALRRLVNQGKRFDTVLLDPPRAGANDALQDIVLLRPEKIIYVSCDPNTLARDCGLLADSGYRVAGSVPIDMFPQTYHIESVTLLIK